MRIAVVAPINVFGLADLLSTADESVALLEQPYSATAPTMLVRELVKLGHDVIVVTHGHGRAPATYRGDGLEIVRVRSRPREWQRTLDAWRHERLAMMSTLRESRPDVVHAHWTYEWAHAALGTGLPTAITIRDAPFTVLRYAPDVQRTVRLFMALRTRIAESRAVFAAPSPYMAKEWRRQTASRALVRTIPNMVAAAPEIEEERAAVPTLVEIADDGPRKNVRNLLRAFRILRSNVPDARLRLLGRGLGPGDPIAREARTIGCHEGVEFYGTVSAQDVSKHLRQSWLHVHAAFEESFGNTLVEAMAAGAPVMGGRSSAAVPWVLDGGKAGFLTDVTSPEVMASDMERVLSDESMRRRLAEAGLHRSLTTFSPDSVTAATLSMYSAAIEKLGK